MLQAMRKARAHLPAALAWAHRLLKSEGQLWRTGRAWAGAGWAARPPGPAAARLERPLWKRGRGGKRAGCPLFSRLTPKE